MSLLTFSPTLIPECFRRDSCVLGGPESSSPHPCTTPPNTHSTGAPPSTLKNRLFAHGDTCSVINLVRHRRRGDLPSSWSSARELRRVMPSMIATRTRVNIIIYYIINCIIRVYIYMYTNYVYYIYYIILYTSVCKGTGVQIAVVIVVLPVGTWVPLPGRYDLSSMVFSATTGRGSLGEIVIVVVVVVTFVLLSGTKLARSVVQGRTGTVSKLPLSMVHTYVRRGPPRSTGFAYTYIIISVYSVFHNIYTVHVNYIILFVFFFQPFFRVLYTRFTFR